MALGLYKHGAPCHSLRGLVPTRALPGLPRRWTAGIAVEGTVPSKAAARPWNECCDPAGVLAQQQAADENSSKLAVLAGVGLAASMLLVSPVALAEEAATAGRPLPGLHEQIQGPVLPGGVALPPPEAPALVSNSSDALFEGVKEAVAGGLQEIAANRMTAVGGPVVGEVLSAGLSPDASTTSSSNSTAAPPVTQPEAASAGANTAAAAAAAAAATAAAKAPATNSPSLVAGPAHHLLCGMWQAYCHALETSPLTTKVYTGVVGTLLGDMAAQLLSHHQAAQQYSNNNSTNGNHRGGATTKLPSNISSSSSSSCKSKVAGPRFQFDALRCGRLCLYSAAIGTPMGHYWYELLETFVMPASPTAPAAVATKVCLDQMLQTPFGMALFFALMKVMEGRPADVQQELKSKMVPALLANWKLWPAAQLVNFLVIPTEQRILFGNIVGICWTCIISNMQQSSSSTGAAVTPPAVPKLSRPSSPMPA